MERNSTTCKCIFHQFAVKNVNVVIMIYCQHNWIFLRQKKIISIHYLTGQNRGLSGLKNIWPVIMTGNLPSVICSPEKAQNHEPKTLQNCYAAFSFWMCSTDKWN